MCIHNYKYSWEREKSRRVAWKIEIEQPLWKKRAQQWFYWKPTNSLIVIQFIFLQIKRCACMCFNFIFFDLKDRRIDRRYKIFVNIYCVNLMKCIESSSNKWALYFLLAVPLFLKITISFMPSAKLWIRKENTQKNSIKLFWKLLDEIELKEQLDTLESRDWIRKWIQK